MSNRLLRARLFGVLAACIALVAFAPPAQAQTLGVAPTQLTFIQDGSAQAPPAQTISVSGSPGSLPFTLSTNVNWLNYGVSVPFTPAIITVQVNPSGLAQGAYSGILTITSTGAANSPVSVAITLYVTATTSAIVNPTQLTFNYSSGGAAPAAQTVYVGGSGAYFSATTSETWLSVGSNSPLTPAQLTVSVNPFGLLPNTYYGNITVTMNTSPVTYHMVSVTLVVDSAGSLWTTSGPMTFNYRYGDPQPTTQTLSVSSATIMYFSVLATSSTGWLKVDPTTGITPASLSVWVDPTGLAAGTYTGTITLTSLTGYAPASVLITLVVTGAPDLLVQPSTLDFQATSGGGPPATRTVAISSTPSTGFTAQVAGVNWITVNPTSGVTPQTLTVGVNPANLAPGTYRGTIIISPTGNPGTRIIVVSLTVAQGAPVAVTVSPASLRFDATPGAAAPAPQTITVSAAAAISVAAAANPGWLSVTPSSGTTPTTFSVSVVSAGMAAGIHSGTITVATPGGTTAQQSIPVTLNIAGAAPSIRELSNGGGMYRDLAPGSLITVYGTDLGPVDPLAARVVSGRQVETTLGGVRLLINGIASPLLHVSSTRINAIVPFEVSGQSRLEIRVLNQNVSSDVFTLPLDATAPVLFTADGSGRGQGAIVNQFGSLNGPSAPAPRDSVVLIYGTGAGVFEFNVPTGSVADGPGPRPLAPVTVYIGGVVAELLYAGPAPGTVAGILQFNARVPREAAGGGAVPVTIRIGDAFSQNGVTMAIE